MIQTHYSSQQSSDTDSSPGESYSEKCRILAGLIMYLKENKSECDAITTHLSIQSELVEDLFNVSVNYNKTAVLKHIKAIGQEETLETNLEDNYLSPASENDLGTSHSEDEVVSKPEKRSRRAKKSKEEWIHQLKADLDKLTLPNISELSDSKSIKALKDMAHIYTNYNYVRTGGERNKKSYVSFIKKYPVVFYLYSYTKTQGNRSIIAEALTEVMTDSKYKTIATIDSKYHIWLNKE